MFTRNIRAPCSVSSRRFYCAPPKSRQGRLQGKKALITGAAAGIGRVTTLIFAREGAQVIATDRDISKMNDLANIQGVSIAKLDVTDKAAIASVTAKVGSGVTILVNCAGYVHHGTILDCSEEDFDFTMDINVKGIYRLTRALIPGMLSAGTGSIINIASVAGSIKGIPNRFAYGGSKAAVIGLTKAIAIDFAKQGIRCNAICPGTTLTPSLEDRIAAGPGGDVEATKKAFIARQPVGRLGKPEEIAEMALYLASDLSAFTTGTTMIVDGGFSL